MRDAELPGEAPDPWTLLAVAYAGGDGRGVNLDTVRTVAGIIRQATLTDESLTPISAAGKTINLFVVGSPDSTGIWLVRHSDH